MDTLLSLYTDDAVIESPLIPHVLERDSGICKGKEEIRQLVEIVAKRKSVARGFYREKYFTDGKTIIWEYPRKTPDGEQMDFVEVMEIDEGLICYHRVYWGWKGVSVLQNDKYYADND